METVADRIILLVNHLGGNKSDFARRINLTPAYISKLAKHSDSIPSDRTIADICREFHVDEHWLRTGEGEMFRPRSRSEELAAFFGDLLADTPDFRHSLITVLSRMSPEEWAILEKKAWELVDEMKKTDPQ